MKRLVLILIALMVGFTVMAQDVTLVVIGYGATKPLIETCFFVSIPIETLNQITEFRIE